MSLCCHSSHSVGQLEKKQSDFVVGRKVCEFVSVAIRVTMFDS